MPRTQVLLFRNATGAAPVQDWLENLERTKPAAYAKCIARILQLEQSGHNLRRPAADFLRDGIWELRAKLGRVHYRILYFYCGSNVCCLSHGLTKEDKVPSAEIDRAVERKKLVEEDRDRYTAEWE